MFIIGRNRLLRINEQANDLVFKLKGFRPKTEANGSTSTGGIDYTYDANGNQTSDPHKGIASIQYNYLNLPSLISYTDGREIEQRYDATGNLIFRWMKDAAGPPSNNYFQTYVYGTEYRGSSIESVSHQEGRLFRTSGSSSNPVWRYEYSISDHLGNTRLTFADKTPDGVIKIEDGEVLEEAHYYPFGLAMEGPWMNDAAALDNRYKFNGIERVQDFGLNMDLAMYRSYDPAIGRWWQADPIVKPWENPYAAMYNNPMNWSDFLGADPEEDGDSDSSDQGRRPRKPKKGKDLPEVVVTAKRVENNSPITNLQIHLEGVYFQKGESWYKVTEAPLAEGGGQLYGYDARAGWVRVSSSYQDYKSQLEAATTLADGMTTAVAIVEGFFGAGVMFNAGLLAPAKAGLRTVPATGRGAQASRMMKITRKLIPLTKKSFGHTFTTHGQNMTNFLMNRARGSGMPQGQFLDDQKAAKFILDNIGKTSRGSVDIPLPNGFPARIIMPDGTFKAATHIRLVPGGGGVKTAYPLIP